MRATNMERVSRTQGGNGKSDLSLPMQVKGSIATRQAGNRPTNKGTTAAARQFPREITARPAQSRKLNSAMYKAVQTGKKNIVTIRS